MPLTPLVALLAALALPSSPLGEESTYRLPFERFERYSPFGTAAEVAEFIAPYVEAGARHINLIPMQGTPEGNIEAARQVQEKLGEMIGDGEEGRDA